MSQQRKESQLDPASFVVVANRLPVDRVERPDGTADWRPSPADWLLLSIRSCTSAAAPGSAGMVQPTRSWSRSTMTGWRWYQSRSHPPTSRSTTRGFSNATLWPLYHDAIATPQFRREWWETYVKVNQRFADYTARAAAEGAVVWIQDYQLQLVPRMLRRQRRT